jgi:hypothetical protein
VILPTFLMEGPLVWPGQHAGFLGPKYDPWHIKKDPNRPNFREDSLTLPVGFSVERLQGRRRLLDELASGRDSLSRAVEGDPMADQRESAYSLLMNGQVARAFDLKSEDPRTRDRYGRHTFGQSLLLARRLVQAGVPIVQANLGAVQTGIRTPTSTDASRTTSSPRPTARSRPFWTTWRCRASWTRRWWSSPGSSAGRRGSPSTAGNPVAGRDHWAAAFSSAFAGAGVRGGQFIGQTDKVGAYPASRSFSPDDLAATIFSALGLDPEAEMRDKLDRPLKVCNGSRIEPLYSGATA